MLSFIHFCDHWRLESRRLFLFSHPFWPSFLHFIEAPGLFVGTWLTDGGLIRLWPFPLGAYFLFSHNKIYLPFMPTWWLNVNQKAIHNKGFLRCCGDLSSSFRIHLFAFLLNINGQWPVDVVRCQKSSVLISEVRPLFTRPDLFWCLEVLEMLGWFFIFTFY